MSMPPASPRPIIECEGCNTSLQFVGRIPLSKEASANGIIAPAIQGDGQTVVPIEMYRCPGCGKIGIYDFDLLLTGF